MPGDGHEDGRAAVARSGTRARGARAAHGGRTGGQGGVLVLHGEPGVGKTALLDVRGRRGTGLRVVRTTGVEGEMELPYAALQQLCAPILASDRAPARSTARRARRRVRTQRRTGAEPVPRRARGARSVVGGGRGAAAALRHRRCPVARRASARALAFLARRLAGREDRARCSLPASEAPRSAASPRSTSDRSGIVTRGSCWSPCCRLGWMTGCSSASSLETGGNPLALLELPRGMTPVTARGRLRSAGGGTAVRAGSRRHFVRRLATLPRRRSAPRCSSRRPTRRATRRSCRGRRSGSGSQSRRRERSNRTACSISVPASPSAIRWPVRPSTGGQRR